MRQWTDIDWHQPPPSRDAVVASWQDLEWEPVAVTAPDLDHYLDQVRATHVNGGFLFGRWRARHYSDVTAWFVGRNRPDEYELLRVFLDSERVRTDLAELGIPTELDSVPGGLREQWGGALCLDGLLAGVIVQGGAYRKYAGPAREAKDLAARAVTALTQQRYEDFRLDVSREPWAAWFGGVAWDSTFVLTDLATAELTVLCITDSD